MPGSDAQFLVEAGPSGSRLQETAASRFIMKILTRSMVRALFSTYPTSACCPSSCTTRAANAGEVGRLVSPAV